MPAAQPDEVGHPRAVIAVRDDLEPVVHDLDAATVRSGKYLPGIGDLGNEVAIAAPGCNGNPLLDRKNGGGDLHISSSKLQLAPAYTRLDKLVRPKDRAGGRPRRWCV